MQLVHALTAMVATAELAQGRSLDRHTDRRMLESTYAKCTAAGTKLFLDNLRVASSGCATSTSYVWDGNADPTDAQRATICKCDVSPFEVPKCAWMKQGKYNIATSEHFGFVYNCTGKTTPAVTEVDATATTTTTPATSSSGSKESDLCTSEQIATFTSNLKSASNGCAGSTSYNWGGSANPTDTQFAEICKCAVGTFTIPACTLPKEGEVVTLSAHYKWVKFTKCPSLAPSGAASSGQSSGNSKDLCSVQQMSEFSSNLKSVSSCLGSANYNWGGNTNPTDTQYAEICKCASPSSFTIPSCSVLKGPDQVGLVTHYEWVLFTQCPVFNSSGKSSNVGLIAGIAGGCVVVVLLIGFLLWKRKREASSQDDEEYLTPNNMNAMRSPAGYRSVQGTPQYSSKNNEPRPSAASTATYSTISTNNSSMRPSGAGSYRASGASRPTETGKWDDPVILAVRIPYDSIFFGSLISRGGFGEVYRGTCRGETVAIKNLLPERRKDLAQIDNFLSEVKLMSTLEHERIVKFIGVAWNSLSDACMVVEFMENGDLRSVFGRWDTTGPEQRATGFDADKVKIALHVAHALVYLHSLQPVVVHRDLKSKNVLLDANLDAKLTDFGISRERADSTMTGGVGSSLWMAPEVMMGARYDEKADIFSFGVVLSELDTHQLPYAHARAFETGQKLPEAAILQQVMLGRISVGFSDRADPQLVQLGRECVSLDPDGRPTTAQVLHRVHQVMAQYKYVTSSDSSSRVGLV